MLFICKNRLLTLTMIITLTTTLSIRGQNTFVVHSDPNIEVPPTFPNGNAGLYNHLMKNFKYPNSAWKKQLEGIVRVSFVVNYDGTVHDVEILKGLSLDIDEEVVRIFNLLPRWTTALQNGKRVKVKFVIDFPIEVPSTSSGAALPIESRSLVQTTNE